MKDIVLFLLRQIDEEIVVIDNGTLEEVSSASEKIGIFTQLIREAIG